MKSKQTSVRFLCLTAVMAALVCVATMVIQIPIPLGYANLGGAFIMLAAVFLGKRSGLWAGGIGSAMADLLSGFAMWAIPTFIIKSGTGWIVGHIAYGKDNTCTVCSIRTAVAAIVGMVWTVVGYTVFGAILYGGLAEGLASAPGLAVEGVLNFAVFYGVGVLLEKANIRPLLMADRRVKE